MQRIVSLFLIMTLALATPAWAIKSSTIDRRLIRSAESFSNVVTSDTGRIPPELLQRAQGLLIFRQYEAGFVFGAKGGAGVALRRNSSGDWGDPAFFKSGNASWGLQIGVHRLDLVFLFMQKDAMDRFCKGNFRIGIDAAAAAGPIGGEAEGKIGAPILVYSNSMGLYAGAKFEGGLVMPDKVANESYYKQPGISCAQILEGKHNTTGNALTLRNTISRYEGSFKQVQPKNNWWQGALN